MKGEDQQTRRRVSLDLISRDDIETQEELAEKLNAEGFPVTQATVSRDIREMKLTKVTNDREAGRFTK